MLWKDYGHKEDPSLKVHEDQPLFPEDTEDTLKMTGDWDESQEHNSDEGQRSDSDERQYSDCDESERSDEGKDGMITVVPV
jgi:hypothetical protein